MWQNWYRETKTLQTRIVAQCYIFCQFFRSSYLIVCIQQKCSVCQHIFFDRCFCRIGRYLSLAKFIFKLFFLGLPFEIPTFHVGSQLALPTFKIIFPRWLAWCWARRATSPPGCLPPPSASSSMLPSCPCSLRSRCFLRAILNYWSWCKFSKANSLAGILLNTLGMIGGALLLLGIGLYEPELEAFFGGEHDH